MITFVAHDPFARVSLARLSLPGVKCAWCGSRPRTSYKYVQHSDGNPHQPDFRRAKPVCNLECHRAFHHI